MRSEALTILHLDLDAFFAAVEVLLNPALAGLPVIVGAEPGQRGVVATASYEAREFGVHSAMPIGQAYQLCPGGVFVRPRHGVYRDYSQRVFRIVERFSERMQQVSIDEAFVALDPSRDPIAAARDLKALIKSETGLVASMGLATSKLVSKIASDQGKPDGFVVVPPGTEALFLARLPVRKLWGVGPKGTARLLSLGIETIGDLATTEPARLSVAFGPRQTTALVRRARGEDSSAVEVDREIKSISDEHTFQRDEEDASAIWKVLKDQSRACADRLKRHELLAGSVTVKLRFGDFRTITRSLSLALPTDDPKAIRLAVATLMRQWWAASPAPLRLVGVRVSALRPPSAASQLPLFP